jgi:hypothetical protein
MELDPVILINEDAKKIPISSNILNNGKSEKLRTFLQTN